MASAPSITLSAISRIAYRNGAYAFSVNPSPGLQAGEWALLQVASNEDGPCIAMGPSLKYVDTQLPALLQCLANMNRWAQAVPCQALRVTPGGPTELWVTDENGRMTPGQYTVVARSAASNLIAPVEPYHHRLYPGSSALRKLGTSIPRIPYVWTGTAANPIGEGRYLTPCIGNRHYFIYDGLLETNAGKRGLDCTTFVTSAFDVHAAYSSGAGAFGDGSKVADCLGALSCELEGDEDNPGVTGADLSAFFAENLEGEFIIWRPGKHCMMVIRGALLEYTVAPVWGFRETAVQTYLGNHADTRYIVRALPGTVAHLPIGSTGGDRAPAGSGPSRGGAGGGAGGGGSGGGGNGKTYTVVSGDSLSLITGRLWGDVLLWPILYDANRAVVGSNPNLIKPGQKLTVPDIGKYSSGQLADARNRGRR